MSSKKNQNKAEKKKINQAARKKEKQKKIIIGVVAAVVAIAIIVVGFVFLKPYVEKKIEEKKQEEINPSMPSVKEAEEYEYEVVDKPDGMENSSFTFVNYRGVNMPEEMAEILNQAEADNAAACKNQGIAIVIGDHQISVPRFELYYYEESIFTIAKLINQVQENNGQNNTGYDFDKAPADQEYGGKGYDTWAEKFTDDALNSLTFSLVNFERALESGTQLTDTQFRTIIQGYESILVYAEEDGITPNEYIANICGEGATYEMYASMIILQEYAKTFDADELDRIAESVTEEELEEENSKNPLSHMLASVTLYPIEGDFDESEVNSISTKQGIINYAAERANSENYDANSETNYAWVSYKGFADTFGEPIAEWIFSEDRDIGDVAVVQGTIFPCLICMNELPFESNSIEALVFSSYFDEDISESNIKAAQEEIEDFEERWKNGDFGSADEAGLDYAINDLGAGERLTLRIGDFAFNADEWLHDPSREYGDTKIITTTDGVFFFFFVKSNTEDLDWKYATRYTIAQQRHNDITEELINDDYQITARNEVGLSKAYAHSNTVMQGFIQSRLP